MKGSVLPSRAEARLAGIAFGRLLVLAISRARVDATRGTRQHAVIVPENLLHVGQPA